MSKSAPFFVTYAILLLSAHSLSLVCCAEQQTTVIRDALNLTVPNPFGDTPIFETNDNNGGRLISLHIPYLLDTTVHFRGTSYSETLFQFKLLSGLINLNLDRTLRGGQLAGPVQLSMLGYSLYDNQAVTS